MTAAASPLPSTLCRCRAPLPGLQVTRGEGQRSLRELAGHTMCPDPRLELSREHEPPTLGHDPASLNHEPAVPRDRCEAQAVVCNPEGTRFLCKHHLTEALGAAAASVLGPPRSWVQSCYNRQTGAVTVNVGYSSPVPVSEVLLAPGQTLDAGLP
jgi:hypothetical protein